MNDLKKKFADIQERLNQIMKDFPIQDLVESMKIIAEKSPEGFYHLAKYGWFLGYDTFPKDSVELGDKLKNGKEDEVDQILMDYCENTLDEIKTRLIKRNPKRKSIIQEGFKNHQNGNYYSSITLLLTQADGICHDKYKKFYFKNKRTSNRKEFKPEIEEALTNDEGSFILEEFLKPLEQPIAINEHTSKISNFPVRLNRHEILHGIDADYGSKKNSLKIISFLNYVNDIINAKTGSNSD